MPREKSLGQIGYEAYAEHQQWVNYQGSPIPPWSEVRSDIKTAWAVAADALINAWEDIHA